MNITLKKVLSISGILFGVMIVVLALVSLRYLRITSKMTPVESHEINDSVFALRDKYVNAYLFRTEDGYIAFDAGISMGSIQEECEVLGIDHETVKAVFLTHCDGDHSGAVDLFENAEIYMHKDEEALATGKIRRLGPVRYKWKHGEYELMKDGQTISIAGLGIKVIHVPGHTPGSVCYIINNDYLVSGDNLIYSNGKYEHFLEQVNMDTDEQVESLSLLPPPESFKYILSAHHGVHIIEP